MIAQQEEKLVHMMQNSLLLVSSLTSTRKSIFHVLFLIY